MGSKPGRSRRLVRVSTDSASPESIDGQQSGDSPDGQQADSESPDGQRPDGGSLDREPDPENVARSIVLQRLSVAPQTRAQLDAAMRKKHVPDEVRAHILDRFADVGLVDDAAFAQAWVDSRHNGRGLARRALGHELRQRGVDPQVADEAVESLAPEREEETARALVARRLPSTRRLDPASRTRRLAGMLARKGYPAGLSYRVVRDALAAEGVEEDELPPEHVEE